jgi:hypothetical protein
MDKRQVPVRLGTTADALEYVATELCEAATDAHKGEINTSALFDKLLSLSSVVSMAASQVRDAEAASRLTDEQEIGQVLGQVFFSNLLSKEEENKIEDQAVNENEMPQTEAETSEV